MPLGLSLGIPAASLVGMFPAVNGYFFIPNYGTLIAAMQFDRSGTTRIGRYLLNHSFMLPGIVSTVCAITIGLGIGAVVGGGEKPPEPAVTAPAPAEAHEAPALIVPQESP